MYASESNTTLSEYKSLVDTLLSQALSKGLRPNSNVSVLVAHKSKREDSLTFSSIQFHEVIVSYYQPAFYQKGLLWLMAKPDDPNYRLFQICFTDSPDPVKWILVNDVTFVYDPLSYIDYIESIKGVIDTNTGGGGGPSDPNLYVELSNSTGGTVTKGMLVYRNGANLGLAQANHVDAKRVLGMVYDTSVASGATAKILMDGKIEATTGEWDALLGTVGGLVVNRLYYLSATVAGKPVDTAPDTSGNWVVRIGRAISTTIMDVQIQPSIKL